MPTEQRRGEVCGCEKVQGARKSNAGDTVSARANPGDLGTVDGEVRGNGAIQALLGEDFGGISLRCGGSSVSLLYIPSHSNSGRRSRVHQRPPHGVGLLDGKPPQRLLSNLLRDHSEGKGLNSRLQIIKLRQDAGRRRRRLSTPADYERQDATEDEINKLPHIADSTSSIVWIALVVSGAEWFLFYATTTPWRRELCAV